MSGTTVNACIHAQLLVSNGHASYVGNAVTAHKNR